MKTFQFLSTNETQTHVLGQQLGLAITQPTIVFLEGTLGTGKTRLAQAIASGLDINPETVTSPTFTIMVPHSGRLTLLHVDAYRVEDLDEAEQLGIDDWVATGCVLLVEWAERIAAVLHPPDLRVTIEHVSDEQRQYNFSALSQHGEELLDAIGA